jgi:hypothetical protein
VELDFTATDVSLIRGRTTYTASVFFDQLFLAISAEEKPFARDVNGFGRMFELHQILCKRPRGCLGQDQFDLCSFASTQKIVFSDSNYFACAESHTILARRPGG